MPIKIAVELEVEKQVAWWIKQRKNKLIEQLTDSMTVNPFMLPFLFEYHDLSNFNELADLLMAGHLMTGHATGFGKLIDEKILPHVFKTQKLDSKFRKIPPYNGAHYNEIDHIVTHRDNKKSLLSLKAGKWTIQLSMAMQLNHSFKGILDFNGNTFENIVVGVFYGQKSGLTDKYDILRGINRGANHDVYDITQRVHILAGKEFWSWLNDDEPDTQIWILNGINNAIDKSKLRKQAKVLLNDYRKKIVNEYNGACTKKNIDWKNILIDING